MMYAVVVADLRKKEQGYFKRLLIHRGKEYDNTLAGLQRIEPVLTTAMQDAKLWKTQKSAISYANGLKDKLAVVTHTPGVLSPFLHTMSYNIQVVDLEIDAIVHSITSYKYRSNAG